MKKEEIEKRLEELEQRVKNLECSSGESEWTEKLLVEFTDEKQGLEYSEQAPKEMDWFKAKEWCEGLGNGWRMPTRGELVTSFDNGVFNGLEMDSHYHWSATENSAANAWGVYLANGYTNDNAKTTSYAVRSVREIKR